MLQKDGAITPILKRKRPATLNGDSPLNKKASVDPVYEDCKGVLERLRATPLSLRASASSGVLEPLKDVTADKQRQWVEALTAHTAVFDKALSSFVLDCLNMPWKLAESAELRCVFQSFLLEIATTHTQYCKPIVKRLFDLMMPVTAENDSLLRVTPHCLPAAAAAVQLLAVDCLVLLHIKVPLIETIIVFQLTKSGPYYKKHPHMHVVYTKCLLMLGSRIPAIRKRILENIIHSLLTIDVNVPRGSLVEDEESDDDEEEQQVFQMEVEETLTEEAQAEQIRKQRLEWIFKHPLAHTLDTLMETLLLFVHTVAHGTPFTLDYNKDIAALVELGCIPGLAKVAGVVAQPTEEEAMEADTPAGDTDNVKPERTLGCQCGGALQDTNAIKVLYTELKDIFVTVILPTHSLAHAQFFMFYLLAIKPALTSIFLEFLRTKVFMNPSAALDERKNAMAYLGSMLVRGKFVHFSLVQSCIEVIVNWCQSYITTQETEQKNNYQSLSLHSTFYCACQTVFYVFSFRYREFTRNRKTLELARNLNLDRLVFSPLNPLAVCTSGIVKLFAAVTRHYQIAYCYTIIENNRRNALPMSRDAGPAASITGTELDMFFPFDPYLLITSSRYIAQHFQEFQDLPEFISTEAEAGTNNCSPNNGTGSNAQAGLNGDSEEEVDDFLDQSGPNPARTNFLDYQFSPEISVAPRRTARDLGLVPQ